MAGFSDPLWLCGLVVIPALAALYWIVLQKRKREALEFSRVALIKSALGNRQSSRRLHIPAALTIAAIALLIVALGGPHIPLTGVKEGVNVVLVIDDSGSMQATDYSPTRLDAAKQAADLLIKNLEHDDNAGVILFESGATTAAYLSSDKDRVRKKLAAIVPRDGETAIGDGLMLAVDMARSIPNKKCVIILLSDGVNNAGSVSVDNAVAASKAARIQVFTVGMGSDKPAVTGYDWLGEPQYATLDEAALRSVAEMTGGQYFRSVDEKTLAEIYAGLNQEIVRGEEETPVGSWFIVASLLLLLAGFYCRYGRGRVIP